LVARFVLVHGAFGGAWVWEPVVSELEAAGHRVEAPDLPGSGDDRTPVEEITLDAYAERIRSVLASDPEPAVLVGHSMGGVAITQAAGVARKRIALLVYVSAFMPADGQSLIELTQLPEGEGDQVQANMTVEGDPPVASLTGEGARVACYGNCNEVQVSWAIGHMGLQAVAPFMEPVRIADPAANDIPRAYVICSRDQAIPPPLQRRMVRDRGAQAVIEIDTDHSPWLSATGELVAALDRLGRESDAGTLGTGDVLLGSREGE
jgi:pimeloyl-ACP methyl ester carboxylesterase